MDCVTGSPLSWDSFYLSLDSEKLRVILKTFFNGLKICFFIELRLSEDETGDIGSKTFYLPNVTVIYTDAHD